VANAQAKVEAFMRLLAVSIAMAVPVVLAGIFWPVATLGVLLTLWLFVELIRRF
jgi:hypothetical protein